MSDETKTAEAIEASAPAPTPAEAVTTDQSSAGDTAEKAIPYARFREVNEKLRAAEKRAADLDAAEKKRQKESLSEADRLKAEAAEWKTAAEKHAAKVRELSLRQAFRSEAERGKLRFANEQAAADAFALIDLAGVEIDDGGDVKGLDAKLKELAKTRPYLFAKPEQANIDAGAGVGKGGPPPQSDATRLNELRQRFRF